MGNHTTVTWNLALWHPAAVIGNGTVDQTSYRLTATEVGHVLVDAIACDLERGYEHDSMPISPMRRTRNRLGVGLLLWLVVRHLGSGGRARRLGREHI